MFTDRVLGLMRYKARLSCCNHASSVCRHLIHNVKYTILSTSTHTKKYHRKRKHCLLQTINGTVDFKTIGLRMMLSPIARNIVYIIHHEISLLLNHVFVLFCYLPKL